ncbi:TrkA family potassium uptake protein [Paenibacillus polysaccharolyticus]|uniref:TrkA family potassium uptake protein n=1 Tax=Paenibacillus cucumis (ex Kampfer et al. 2016) TaxID=1776858 RepID=A0ABS7KIE4_9BACL|nr:MULTISPECIES: TrkA family potassium uptake protein [Paenibacillus]MBY0203935.1 TrkA family potassium uptake protein [Paenibacillus cucumis (ex Kampfer et al. 2016)]MCM3132406.1 TrkA family potassium uptake protein [Paenibacillus polysaccharolyticus]MCP1134108.1 TrkA family potassium uptake protein [Paenibacillus polysaccharolyticus]
MKKQFMVLGLGRFGSSLTRTLIKNGHEVLAVDKNETLVQEISSIATHVVQADCTDKSVLQELGASNFSHAIVAIGEDLQASILATLLLKELNVPKVTAKAKNENHGSVLSKIGADQIVYPERDMATRLGNQLSSDNMIDSIELSPDYNLVELKAPASMHQQTLLELNIRANYGCTIIAIKTGEEINISPLAEDQIQMGDTLLLIGSNDNIRSLERDYERS